MPPKRGKSLDSISKSKRVTIGQKHVSFDLHNIQNMPCIKYNLDELTLKKPICLADTFINTSLCILYFLVFLVITKIIAKEVL